MTENEVKETREWLQDFIRTFGCNFDDLETRGFNECVMFLKELEQCRAIGTIEEFKDLKEKKNVLPIATIKISKEDIQKMVDEKVAQIELDIQDIRAKAIDEFAEMLKEKYEKHNFDLCLRQNDYYSYSNSCMLFESYIDGIAEQLKVGEKNG